MGFSGDLDVLLSRGEAYARRLVREPPARLTDEEILALGYLERARIGLGSPFRLIDYALRDPDLSAAARQSVSYALLSAALNGRTHEVDPVVLDPTRLFGVAPWARTGAAQIDLITRTIAAAPSPTSGERAVRLGYAIAETERAIGRVPRSSVAQVAALVADRFRTQADARLLLRTAAANRIDPLALLQDWRRDLRFEVERPSLVPLTVREEAAVARAAPNLAQALEALALRLSTRSPHAEALVARQATDSEYLGYENAARLLDLSVARGYPAQAPIAVAVTILGSSLPPRTASEEAASTDWADFREAAINEERLVAAAARVRGSGTAPDHRLGRLMIQSAAFLRAWGQEEPWFPGDAAPATRDLVARFGLAGIDFDADVPESWRPYYLRTLARALFDLQRVLPTASVRGLRVVFGPIPTGGRSLALHEPATRTLYLPPASGAGTIAHEIAHDLDWQLARRRYGRRGGYATDLAVRAGRRDRIDDSLRGLSAAFGRPGADTIIDRHDTRPAEIFARGTDWFIAAALAREGRTAGYLSSFQDPALTGYGTTRGPDVGGGAVQALLTILDEIAPVADDTRRWARSQLGPSRSLTPSELAGALLRAGSDLPPEERLGAVAEARDRSLSALNTASCRLSSTVGMRQLAAAQRELVRRSVAAAARGAAIDAVRALAADHLGPGDPRGDYWLAWRLYGAPEPADPALLELAPAFEDLLHRADLVAREEPAPAGTAFRPAAPAALCGGNPFAAAVNRGSGALLGSAPEQTPGAARAIFRF